MQLLLTKLCRPAPPGDPIVRPRLIDSGNGGLGQALAQILARAGCGQALPVSSVLDSSLLRPTWRSLDRNDSDRAVSLELHPGRHRVDLPQVLQAIQSYDNP